MKTSYIDLLTDFGFKHLFENESRLIKLINQILPATETVISLRFESVEQTRQKADEKTVVYDLHCQTLDGRVIIVEIQRAAQVNFAERVLYYAARAIDRQVLKGGSYDLKPTYLIAFCNFSIPTSANEYRQVVELKTLQNTLFTDKLRFYFFNLKQLLMSTTAKQLTPLEQWLKAMATMGSATDVPEWATDLGVRELYEAAEIANLNPQQRREYEAELKRRRDLLGAYEFQKNLGRSEGIAEGIAEGKAEGKAEGIAEGKAEGILLERRKNVQSMHAAGMSIEQISSILEIEQSEVLEMLKEAR